MPGNVPVLRPADANPSTPPLPAKAVSLQVRPFFASYLCFETDGILGNLNLSLNSNQGLLGATVPAIDLDVFYAILGSRPTVPATGSITFTTNPAVGTQIVLNGIVWTFVSALTDGNQLLIGSTLDSTLASAVTTLQVSTDANTQAFFYSATPTVLDLTAAAGGSAGNALTISTTVSGATVSGLTLSGGDSSRLLYDFLKIQADVLPFTLATLRAEPRKAALDKAINMRQNAYFAKYANQGTIISFVNQYYFNPSDFGLTGPYNTYSKTARLDNLNAINEARWAALNDSYAAAGRQDGDAGVVDEVISQLASDTTGYGYAESSEADQTTILGAPSGSGVTAGVLPQLLPDPPAPPKQWPPAMPAANWPATTAGQWNSGWIKTFNYIFTNPSYTYDLTSSYQTNSNSSTEHQDQSVKTSTQTFRHPFYNAKAQYQRAQISLIDQRLSALVSAQNIPHLATVFRNELASIDADVYRLQISFLNTILMSPVPGVVTGVFKNPGDPVKAGEPVVRVEYLDVVLIEAIVIFRGPVLVNQTTVTITTALFSSSSGAPTSISGLVVAARGQNDDDTWHLIVECANPDGIPAGYCFDPDDTTVTLA